MAQSIKKKKEKARSLIRSANMTQPKDSLSNKTEHHKNEMLVALEKTLGVVTAACMMAKVGRTQFYEWIKTDQAFADKVTEMKQIALDYTESQLFGKIRKGDTTAMIFYLKTQGKERGYIERTETDFLGQQKIVVEIV